MQQSSKRPEIGEDPIREGLEAWLRGDDVQVVRVVEILCSVDDGSASVKGWLTHAMEAKEEEGVAVRILVNPAAPPKVVARLLRNAATEYLRGWLTINQQVIGQKVKTPEEAWVHMEEYIHETAIRRMMYECAAIDSASD